MLKLETCYSLSQVPYITYDALERYAERLVWDFSPMLLNTPGVVCVDEFLEYYLRLTLDFRRICLNKVVLGLTAFNDGIVDIINDIGQPDRLQVTKGTVIIDTSLTSKKNEPRLRFTCMHEGAHWMIHREAFAENNPFGPLVCMRTNSLWPKPDAAITCAHKKRIPTLSAWKDKPIFLLLES